MSPTHRHVVMFSGGACSWAAAKRVAERHGTDTLTLLFTDTLIEDEDLYRFLCDAAANVGGQFVRIADGRTPWQVFRDGRFLGNTRVDLCSRILKRELADKWLRDNCDPAQTTVYVGLDWTEMHRVEATVGRYGKNGWRCEAPMAEAPHLSKLDILDWLRREGLEPGRSYAQGFGHDNCGGTCVRAGHGHWERLLRLRPEKYAEAEAEEAATIAVIGSAIAILRDRTGGTTKPLTLRAFRERVQGGAQVDLFDIGGCGCFVDTDPPLPTRRPVA